MISTIMNWNSQTNDILSHDEAAGVFDSIDGYSEEEAYRQGRKTLNINAHP